MRGGVGSNAAEVPDAAELNESMRRVLLRSRSIVEGLRSGMHPSPVVGHGGEFSAHRRYVRGDDPRRINWKVYARHRQLFVKQFDTETNLNVHLVIDASGSMSCRTGVHPDKYEYAAAVAMAIAVVALGQRDSVGLTLVADGGVVDHVGPRGDDGQHGALLAMVRRGRRIVDVGADGGGSGPGVAEAKPAGVAAAIAGSAGLSGRRGVVVVLSDWIDDVAAIHQCLAPFRDRGHDGYAIQLLDPMELTLDAAGRFRVEDPESSATVTTHFDSVRKAYRDRVTRWIESVRHAAAEARMDHRVVTTDTPAASWLAEIFHSAAR